MSILFQEMDFTIIADQVLCKLDTIDRDRSDILTGKDESKFLIIWVQQCWNKPLLERFVRLFNLSHVIP